MKRALLALVMASVACEPPRDRVMETLRAYGFTEIDAPSGDWSAFQCSDSDDYLGQKFTAKNAQGLPIKGVVCCGYFKSCTVRF